jgi:hypothetical protein
LQAVPLGRSGTGASGIERSVPAPPVRATMDR